MRTQAMFRPAIILFALFIILLMAGSSMFLFTCLDSIVHYDLYRYGLQFSYEWAAQYWNYSRLILSFLGIAIFITSASIALALLQMRTYKIDSAKFVTSFLLITGIAMFTLSVFFFTRLDYIVHNDLYRYGLQFSYEWAAQYWNYSRLILSFLGIAIGTSGISVVLISIGTPLRKIPLLPSLRAIYEINLTKLICYLLTSTGVTTLAFSTNYNSSILAFIGLGLTFWGMILFYIRPENYIKETLLDKTTLPSFTNLNQMIRELGYKGKTVYLPPKYFRGFESSKVYISAGKDKKLPLPEKTQHEEDKLFIKNPDGALITPLGIELKRLFEKTLGISFTKVDVQYLEQNMPKLLVEDLEIAQEVQIATENSVVFVKIKRSIYQSICKEAQKLSKIYCSLGCPLCSAIACALAEATGKLVVIEKEQTGDDGQTTEIEYYLLEPKEEETQK